MDMKKFNRLTRRLLEVKEAVDHKNLFDYDTRAITLHELFEKNKINFQKFEKLWKICVNMAKEA